MTELNTKEYYAKQQKAFNAKIGDRVFIFQRCESHENGWNDSWCEYMNSSVGQYGTIKSIDQYHGYQISTPYCSANFPYFVLNIIR